MKTRAKLHASPGVTARRTVAREKAAPYRAGGADYPFSVRRLAADEGGGYFIEFPDLPGCISDGETVEEAVSNGMEAKREWLTAAQEQGRAVSAPGGQLSGKWVQRVPKSLHARLVERAEREGVSLNTLVISLIAEGLGKTSRAGTQTDVAESIMRENRDVLKRLAK
jgi:antitoxin HicB